MDLKKIGTLIRKKREEIGISPSVLADRVGIRRPTLWIYERGENPKTGKTSRPSKDKLERLAEVLRMSPSETEELLSLADYTIDRQPLQNSSQNGGTIQHSTLSLPATITEINGTVYYAENGYLEAFDAKTGNRLWHTSTGVSPLEPAHASEVAIEDLPTLKYSEIQTAFPHRRRSGSASPIVLAVNDKTPVPLLQQNQSHQISKERQGILFVLSSIAGYETDKIIDGLKKTGINIFVSPICTTRSLRLAERQDDNQHTFISEEDFEDYIGKNILLTYVQNKYIQNRPPAWYGHVRAPIMQSLRSRQDVIMDAGPEEAVRLRREIPDAILILLRPPHDIRDEADHKRWEKRLRKVEYNHTIDYESGQVEQAVERLHALIVAEHDKVREEQMVR
jgi:guanylate kinase/transcriptional regulator with XRE-family HTH domain